MNKENLKTLIATIEEAAKNGAFDLNHYVHECGSPACIAGYAAHLLGRLPTDGSELTNYDFHKILADYLDVYMYDAREIAQGFCDIGGISVEPRAKEAVRHLKDMLEAGRVLTWRSYFAEHGWD